MSYRNVRHPHPARSAVLPLGALAAGFGLALSPVMAQTADEATLPRIKVKAQAEAAGKDNYQATDTRIGKGVQELRDVPQSVTVVTERLIDDRNLDTLKDTLKNTAGITFQAAEGAEEDIRLRGFSLQSTGDIFIDGMRDPAFYERDSFNWDRLELLRGSASMLFGRGSTGGAVNQVSKQPGLMDENEVTLTVGTGAYVRTTGDFNLKTGENAAFRVNAMVNKADNHGAEIDKRGIAPTFRWGIGTRNEFSAGLYHLENDNGIHYGLPWLTPGAGGGDYLWPTDPENYYGMASDYAAGGTTQANLGHIHRFGNGGELKTAFRAATYKRDQRASAIRFAAAADQPGGLAVDADTFGASTVLRRSGDTGVHAKIMDMETRHLQSDYSGKFGWGGLSHDVQGGFDLAREQFENRAISPLSPTLAKPRTTVGTPNDGASVDEGARITRLTQNFQANALGIYFQDLVQVAPSWKVLAGLRWDRFEGSYWQPELSNALGVVTQTEATRERTDSRWSKRFGLLYQPTALQSFHLSYGTSFNTSGDTYRFDPLGTNTPPESSRNIELGARLDSAGGNFTSRLALFHTTKYNERNLDEPSPDNYVLSGQRHAAGLEVDLTGRPTRDWEVYGSYAFIPWAKIDKGRAMQGETVGSRPGLTPRHSGTIWTTYQVTRQWRIGGGLNARSSDIPAGRAATSSVVAPKFITADLMAEYVMNALSFKLNVTNVTDEHHADMVYRGHYIPGKPRTVQLTTAFKF